MSNCLQCETSKSESTQEVVGKCSISVIKTVTSFNSGLIVVITANCVTQKLFITTTSDGLTSKEDDRIQEYVKAIKMKMSTNIIRHKNNITPTETVMYYKYKRETTVPYNTDSLENNTESRPEDNSETDSSEEDSSEDNAEFSSEDNTESSEDEIEYNIESDAKTDLHSNHYSDNGTANLSSISKSNSVRGNKMRSRSCSRSRSRSRSPCNDNINKSRPSTVKTTTRPIRYQTRSATGALSYQTKTTALPKLNRRRSTSPIKITYYDNTETKYIDEGCRLFKVLSRLEAEEARIRLEKYRTKAIWNGKRRCEKRRMAKLEKTGPDVIMKRKVLDKLTELGELIERSLSNAATLHSLDNSSRQKSHRNFNPDYVSQLKPGSVKPASLLLCIQEGTSLVIRGVEHVIPLGYAILFDGDVEHGGASYRFSNVRVHMYFNVDAVPTPVNELFPAQLIQAPRVVISLQGASTIIVSTH